MFDNLFEFGLGLLRIVVYVFVSPAILLFILALATYFTFSRPGRIIELIPRVIGYAVGYLFLVLVIILKVNGYFVFSSPTGPLSLVGFIVFGILGFLVGFFLILTLRLLVHTRVVGFLIAALVGGASTALFFYIFTGEIRDILVVGVVAFLIGVGMYGMLFPDSMRRAIGR